MGRAADKSTTRLRAGLLALAALVLMAANLQAAPARIVSLAPSLTSAICDLGARESLVGVTSFRPERAQDIEVIGTLTGLNLEKILSLRPDLVLASTDANRRRDVERLRTLGLRVEVFEACVDFDAICQGFLRLGELLGLEAEAQRIALQCRDEVALIQARTGRNKPLRIFWQLGTEPLITAGHNTFSAEFIRLAGGINIFAALTARYPRVNREQVLVRNPEVIIIVSDMQASPPAPQGAWPADLGIDAVRNGRIYTIPASLVCQPTPMAFVKGLRTLAGLLYPDMP